jgi:hypothetical protein
LYRGQFDFENFSTQVSDFDPGIDPYPEGVFWTVPIPDEAVTVELGAGQARMVVKNLNLFDFFNIPNALFRFQDPVSEPAACSFDIQWSGPVASRSQVNDPTVGFAGQFLYSQVTMQWSASRADGSTFVSNPAGTTSAFAQLGQMQNGRFYVG